MTASDKLLAIYPVLKVNTAAGRDYKLNIEGDAINITPAGAVFNGSFMRDLAAVCAEEKIGWCVGGEDNKPVIYL